MHTRTEQYSCNLQWLHISLLSLETATLGILFDFLGNTENLLLLFVVQELCPGDLGEDSRQIRVVGVLFHTLELFDTSLELDLLDNAPESASGTERLDLGQQVVVGGVLTSKPDVAQCFLWYQVNQWTML